MLKLDDVYEVGAIKFIKIKDKELYYKLCNERRVPNYVCIILFEEGHYSDHYIPNLNIKFLDDISNLDDISRRYTIGFSSEVFDLDEKLITPFEYIDPAEFGLENNQPCCSVNDLAITESEYNNLIISGKINPGQIYYTTDTNKTYIGKADYSSVQDIKNFDDESNPYPYAITVSSNPTYSSNCITYNTSDFNTTITIPNVAELENKVKELEEKLEKYQSKETQFNENGEVIW